MTTTISIRYIKIGYNINNVESELTNYGIYNTVIVFIVSDSRQQQQNFHSNGL